MRRLPERYDRVRFRALDERAREAVRSILERLPSPDDPGAHGPQGDAGWILSRIELARRDAGPLGSPLSYDSVQATRDGELTLVRVEAAVGADPRGPSGREERVLARIRRLGPERYAWVACRAVLDGETEGCRRDRR